MRASTFHKFVGTRDKTRGVLHSLSLDKAIHTSLDALTAHGASKNTLINAALYHFLRNRVGLEKLATIFFGKNKKERSMLKNMFSAYAVGEPTYEMQIASVYLSEKMYKKLIKTAKTVGCSKGAIMTLAVMEFLGNDLKVRSLNDMLSTTKDIKGNFSYYAKKGAKV